MCSLYAIAVCVLIMPGSGAPFPVSRDGQFDGSGKLVVYGVAGQMLSWLLVGIGRLSHYEGQL